jgi:hypothetical protein
VPVDGVGEVDTRIRFVVAHVQVVVGPQLADQRLGQ